VEVYHVSALGNVRATMEMVRMGRWKRPWVGLRTSSATSGVGYYGPPLPLEGLKTQYEVLSGAPGRNWTRECSPPFP